MTILLGCRISAWSYNEKPRTRRISNLKTFLKYLIAVKSCGELNFNLEAIFSNKMAGNSRLKNVTNYVIAPKNRFSRQIDDVILPPKMMKFRNPNRPSCREE